MGPWRRTLAGLVAVFRYDFERALAGKRVLVTGHTGFKGSWLTRWLLELGAEVAGYALEPDTRPALFDQLGLAAHMSHHIGDVRDAADLSRVVALFRPQVVLHLAAQPLVRRSYGEPAYTFEVNVMGTVNLLEAVRAAGGVDAVVNVTTDKVYENPESGAAFAEHAPLGGHDPYSASKACSEIVSASYRCSFFAPAGGPAFATARAGNVIGGGDWSEDRIVPDIIRALAAGEPVRVRNPQSVRPWQHVLEPLGGYLELAAALLEDGSRHAGAFNFGPRNGDARTVEELLERALGAWGGGSWVLPELSGEPHEARLLSLDSTQAHEALDWLPLWDFDETVDRTVGWYARVAGGESVEAVTHDDLAAYTEALRSGPVG